MTLGRKINHTYRDSRQQALWDIGDNNADEEDDCVQPVVAHEEGDDEEENAKEDSHPGDDVDEV